MANVKVAEVVLSERSVFSVKTGSLNLLRFCLPLNISSTILINICIFLLFKQICKNLKNIFDLTVCPNLKQ